MSEQELLKAFYEDIHQERCFCASVFRPAQGGSCDTVAVMYSINGKTYVFAYGLFECGTAEWVKDWDKIYSEFDNQEDLKRHINRSYNHEHVFIMSPPMEHYVETIEKEFPQIQIDDEIINVNRTEWYNKFENL